MQWVKDIVKRIDWKEVAWIQGPWLGILLWLLFGLRAISACTVALMSTRIPGYELPGDFWLWMVPQALFWLAVIIWSLLRIAGQYLDWQDKKKEQGKQLFTAITGKEWPSV